MIGFNKPYLTGNELVYIKDAASRRHLSGDGYYTKKCSDWLAYELDCKKALLTQSCTAALEIAAILADIKEGDEVILPSYTFVSTANAFLLRGAVPVFVDVHQDTLNINEHLIEAAISKRTKAIVTVHYAGVPCEMDKIMEIAHSNDLLVIEDAAQGILTTYKGRPLGSIGDLGCLSFHETKNIISGEGGALLINNDLFLSRAEIIREKGTNRSEFFRGEVDKYSWVDIGSSFLPSEITAAFLWAQLENAHSITKSRKEIWNYYFEAFEDLENSSQIKRPSIPKHVSHNGHIFYLLLENNQKRDHFISEMKVRGIDCVFHYIPLHSSSMGRRFGKISETLKVTEDCASRIVRLPMWIGMDYKEVCKKVNDYFEIKRR